MQYQARKLFHSINSAALKLHLSCRRFSSFKLYTISDILIETQKTQNIYRKIRKQPKESIWWFYYEDLFYIIHSLKSFLPLELFQLHFADGIKLRALTFTSARIRMPKYWIHAKNKIFIPPLFLTFLDVFEVPEHDKAIKNLVSVCLCVCVCVSVSTFSPLLLYTTEVAMVPKSL
jgi:hypothetical protein